MRCSNGDEPPDAALTSAATTDTVELGYEGYADIRSCECCFKHVTCGSGRTRRLVKHEDDGTSPKMAKRLLEAMNRL